MSCTPYGLTPFGYDPTRDVVFVAPKAGTPGAGFYSESWAVIIGINDYQHPRVPRLRYAVNDAKSIQAALLAQGFRHDRIITLLDARANGNRASLKPMTTVSRVSASGANRDIRIAFAPLGKERPDGRQLTGADPTALGATASRYNPGEEPAALNTARVVLNYKDYEALPNDGRRYEIHAGELSVTPAPSPRHQRILRELFRILDAHVRSRGLGEVFFAPIDVIFTDVSIVQPDLVYLTSEQRTLVSSRGIEGAPTMLVEILSPSTAQIDRHAKLQLYARHGVPYYWIVDGETRSIEAYSLTDARHTPAAHAVGSERFAARPFADLEIPLAALWA